MLRESLSDGRIGICVCDIDDTLIKTDPKDFGVWKTKKGKRTRISTLEFEKDWVDRKDPSVHYDFSEFQDPEVIRDSIIHGTPLKNNLKLIDEKLDEGYDFCFLTARGREDVIKEVMRDFMRWNHDGELQELGDRFKDGLCVAVSDEKYSEILGNMDVFDKKAYFLKKVCDSYDTVTFFDDSEKNCEAAESLHLDNLEVIHVSGTN